MGLGVVTQCSLVGGYQRFRGTWCIHLKGQSVRCRSSPGDHSLNTDRWETSKIYA
jgi:hypothetical protein